MVSGVSSAIRADLNLAELIVVVLRKYGGSIPAEYLARVLNQNPAVVDEYLNVLEQKHVVKREGETVSLATEP
jgi:Mn-dependent DtxR family transcriptional regulator